MKQTKELRIGVFGVKGVGKSVGVGVLTLLGQDDRTQALLETSDPATVAYLKPIHECLLAGRFVEATSAKFPVELKTRVFCAGESTSLVLNDFAGELTDPIWDSGPKVFSEAVMKWSSAADGLILFVDSASRNAEDQRAIDRLLDELENQPTSRGNRYRTLIVIFTKADKLTSNMESIRASMEAPATATPEEERERFLTADARQLLAGHPTYERLKRQLAVRRDGIYSTMFLVSAVGNQFVKGRGPHPVNLWEALTWAVQCVRKYNADQREERVAAIHRKLEEAGTGINPVLTNMRMLSQEISELAAKDELDPATRRNLAGKAFRVWCQRAGIYAAGLSILCVLGVLGYWRYEAHRRTARQEVYERYFEYVKQNPGDERASARLDYFHKQIDGLTGDDGLGTAELRSRAIANAQSDAATIARIENRWKAEIALREWSERDGRYANNDPQRYVDAHSLLKVHSSHLTIEECEVVNASLAAALPVYEADLRAWQAADAAGKNADLTFAARIRAYQEYETSHPNGLHVQQARQGALWVDGLADDAEFASAESKGAHADAPFPDRIAAYREYLRLRPNGRHKDAARSQVNGLLYVWDKTDYENLHRGFDGTLTTRFMEEKEGLAMQYLQQQHTRRMESSVKKFLNAFEEYKKPRQVWVTVKSVNIPESAYNTLTGNPTPQVILTIGDSTGSTGGTKSSKFLSSYLASPNHRLGPFLVEWGKTTEFQVFVKNVRTLFAEERNGGTISDPLFAPIVLSGTVNVVRNSYRIGIEFDCPELRLPVLPKFME